MSVAAEIEQRRKNPWKTWAGGRRIINDTT
jgi:hypothetical protein